jgi:hypothetical protein
MDAQGGVRDQIFFGKSFPNFEGAAGNLMRKPD